MEKGKNDQALYSHTYIEGDLSQLSGKLLYAIKNSKRRLILGAFGELETMSVKDIRRYLDQKGFRGFRAKSSSRLKIRNYYLKPWLDVGAIEELKPDLFKITSLGKKINRIISSAKEFDLLVKPGHQSLFRELILLELRNGKKTYKELKPKLDLSDFYRSIKILKDAGFLKMNHPKNLPHVSQLFNFRLSPYYYYCYYCFIEGLKNFVEKTGRSWFTEYSIITHLNLKWKALFARPMEMNEARGLLEKGIVRGDIIKDDGSYKISIKNLNSSVENLKSSIEKIDLSIEDLKLLLEGLTLSEKKILDLIEKGCTTVSSISEKSGLHFSRIHKILKKLERRNLVGKYIEEVTMELTEKGKRLADSLFKVKECLVQEIAESMRIKQN